MEEIKKQIESFMLGKTADEKISVINSVKLLLHELSPMKDQPVDCVLRVKNDIVVANDYNPNEVAPPEMELLRVSISEDGYTQPIVTMQEEGKSIVIDGFHRSRVGKECTEVKDMVYGYLPIVIINKEKEGKDCRMASTIRHNRARGTHKVHSMSEIVLELKKRNRSDEKISKQLGMGKDEVLRLAQIQGLAEMFADRDFSEAREPEQQDLEIKEYIG